MNPQVYWPIVDQILMQSSPILHDEDGLQSLRLAVWKALREMEEKEASVCTPLKR
ncbi:hypothetical protein ACOJUR_15405 [Alicyclobacillus tolerans]|uniref:Uncharacterized protein n=1 Tax=Alicyclobacillus tolerans TaxID=90970 RepID=A0ABT9M065_9BACL|nr:MULTISPECIES: hypothetical protein [Alicyclobacillus]MDP9729923.1 hypothetical protein [Alicyclobacillus tengchongensis]